MDKIEIGTKMKHKKFGEGVVIKSDYEKVFPPVSFASKFRNVFDVEFNIITLNSEPGEYNGNFEYCRRFSEEDLEHGLLEIVNENKKESLPFTKSDLRDNDIVTNRNNIKSLWKERQEYNWNEDLTHKAIKECDIIKVERPTELVTVFEREEKISKEDTIKQAQNLIDNMTNNVFNNVLYLNESGKKAIQELINYVKGE